MTSQERIQRRYIRAIPVGEAVTLSDIPRLYVTSPPFSGKLSIIRWRTRCKHRHAYWDGDPDESALWCPDCEKFVGFHCLSCAGEGIVQEDDYECDWVNYGPDLITCPECRGRGWVRERTWQ